MHYFLHVLISAARKLFYVSFYDSRNFWMPGSGGGRICFLSWTVAACFLWQVEYSISHTSVFWPYPCPVSQSLRPRGLTAKNFLSWFVVPVILILDLGMIISYKVSKLEIFGTFFFRFSHFSDFYWVKITILWLLFWVHVAMFHWCKWRAIMNFKCLRPMQVLICLISYEQ